MDKKKELKFNLNNFLISLSLAVEAKSCEYYGTTKSHNKRVAFIATHLAKAMGLDNKAISDIVSYSLIHNIGIIEDKDKSKEYYEFSNEFAKLLPFLNENQNELLYQKEYFNGTGMFEIKDKDLSLATKIISFSILLNEEFDLTNNSLFNKNEVFKFLVLNENKLFSKELSTIFIKLAKNVSFWLDMQDESSMLSYIFGNLEDFTTTITFEDLLGITSVLYYTLNEDSQLLEYCDVATTYYNFEHKDKFTFIIAASLSNLGKLFVSEKILNKKDELDEEEWEKIKEYPYYTKKVLSNIIGFNDINSWASVIQERINREGYPNGLLGKELSLKDRLLATLVAYDALRLNKPYRDAFSGSEAISILTNGVENKLYDKTIVEDIPKYI